ncbi:DUF969 domain-containing protein [Staphylococcus pseudintermedius]|uniref:DUF969 domain-containing protein n=1 Tax=Staphylococcus pseudintermedius TaxID=283734 RepID=UPI0018DC2CFD|nr:DUF969 domain-containing protein [Staphylococcus pseudintermedius]EGQ3500262.1 DUF969 domain-containing protein [Staphylococcus pseudintermedius]EGQ3617253.1 DUF969 domain-containing protein [Staphylococcus pseudintermedius]EHT3416062.1 DUF969 domain-containing protein [Staphylococcus pseudintermedius]EIE3642189.1 DUF969 domain-containing protein [Staphylococcus pseudintermedius]EJG0134321.1 DUF969 domain-containing protein [Staphylococcus pseudintermedius]
MEWLKLIGILIIVLGFYFKWDTIGTVLIAAIVTGLVSHMDVMTILETLGKAFVDNRMVSLFILTLPMVGMIERFGLKTQATRLINRIQGITSGRIMSVYLFIREVAGLASIRIGGHPQFVRPLMNPMVQAAAKAKYKQKIEPVDEEKLKAHIAAMENYGNFFGQNLFVGASGVLLIVATFHSLHMEVKAVEIALYSAPIAIVVLIVGVVQNVLFDRKMNRKYCEKGGTQDESSND